MQVKTITTTLDATSLNKAIREISNYKRELREKTIRLCQIAAEKIATLAAGGFASSPVDILTDGGTWRTAHATVQVEGNGDSRVVVASGSDVIWCEFGTGVYFNGSVGGSPHPKGAELGFTIGGYGKGNGAHDSWTFRSVGGILETHGTPASMPMYKALTKTVAEISLSIAEVFG